MPNDFGLSAASFSAADALSALSVVLTVVAVTLVSGYTHRANAKLEIEAERVRAELDKSPVEAVAAPPQHDGGGEDKSFRILKEYATQQLAQSRVSFRMTLLFAALGFAIVCVGVFIAIIRDDVADAVIPVVAGAVVEATAALFFVNNSRAQRTTIEFFDKIRDDRRLEEALALGRGLGDRDLAARLQVHLALQFSGVDDAASAFRAVAGDAVVPARGRSEAGGESQPRGAGRTKKVGDAALNARETL